MLRNQRPYFDKMGLGYEKEEDEKLAKNSQSKVPTCIYCFKKGHCNIPSSESRPGQKEAGT